MASPLCAGKTKLLLLMAATLILQHSTAAADWAVGAGNSSLAKPGCRDKCGNVSIPYPFGIGKDCFREGFEVSCPPDDVPILNTSGTPLLEINLNFGEARIQNNISQACNITKFDMLTGALVPVQRFFMVSRTRNIFTAIGCSTVALIAGDMETPIGEDGGFDFYINSACGSFCAEDDIDNTSTDCSGRGCCQTAIPRNLKSFFPVFLNNSLIRAQNFNPCSYAFIAETGWFSFDPSYVTSQNLQNQFGFGPPLVLDWVAGNGSCEASRKMGSSYPCIDANSECVDVPNGPGFRCNCSTGYEGNPYLAGGCRDINECDYPSMYSCINGTCTNTIGSYNCTCPAGTQSKDPKNSPCTPIPGTNKQPQVKVVIGTSIGFVLLVICISALLIVCQKRQLAKEKEKFFKQNGGHILYQQILSKQIDTVTLFTTEVLKKATHNYDRSRELGRGGHGTVYKGILDNNKVIAVKRSKIINVVHTEEFVQEIIILSQLNHCNVVRLVGCCLEVEVPILVYEFIPNGTLSQLIHGNNNNRRLPVSLEDRLRIAQESAKALEYLHVSINRPIVHGDVKSLNILLDENYMAKVTDFGASRMLPKDAVQLMTLVQGKSDVYSFGVVLLELITRKKAIYFDGHEEKSLVISFLQALKDNRFESMLLDTSITGAGMKELLQEVGELASQCLSVKGDERPSMTQVADKLKAMRSTWREALLLQHNETEQHLAAELAASSLSFGLPPSMYWTGLDIEAPR